jgi:catechol 2,3-dioxygenase-like lactoylglutathione lyase family enzyme
MRIYVMSVLVDDQAKALDFYTGKLDFIVKHDIPLGAHRWLTVVSKEDRKEPNSSLSRVSTPPLGHLNLRS